MNSSEEIFDVVNEQDEVIAQERRSVVHQKNLFHRAVHILIFNQTGELFLQKRSPWKDVQPNRWVTSCSGHVDSGESYDQAVTRELKEELGIQNISGLRFLFKISPNPETGWEFVQVYLGKSEGPFVLAPEEISEGKFVSAIDLQQWIARSPEDFTSSFIEVWKKYQSTVRI